MRAYDRWIDRQAERVRDAVRAFRGDVSGLAVYALPANGEAWGALVVAEATPPGCVECLRFPGVGSRIAAVPYSGMRSALWEACHRVPVCGLEGRELDAA